MAAKSVTVCNDVKGVDLGLVRDKLCLVVQFYEYMRQGHLAEEVVKHLPRETFGIEALEHAATYLQESSEESFFEMLQDLCIALGVRYTAAKDGDTRNLLL